MKIFIEIGDMSVTIENNDAEDIFEMATNISDALVAHGYHLSTVKEAWEGEVERINTIIDSLKDEDRT